jgi:2-C-methyl-D-erythritol 4-phosphate cytidylyltransferase
MRESAADRDIVLVHDAVRPCTTDDIITECVSGFDTYDGVMPSLPVTDTCYLSFDGKTISRQLPRDQIVAGQTPESYLFGKYYEAHMRASVEYLAECRGSSQIAFENGMKIRITPGSRDNFKITTKEDLVRFAKICGGVEEIIKFD